MLFQNWTSFVTVLVLSLVICDGKSIQNATADEVQDERISSMEKSIRQMERTIQNLNETVQNGLNPAGPVMFYAIIQSKSFVLNTESTIVFETVILNMGGHYNKYDGVFVAPRKGIYFFSWTVSIYSSNYAVTELVVENKIISSAGNTDSSGGYHSGSMTALCRMSKNDHAFIRTARHGSTNHIYSYENYPRTTFLGMMIYED